ncbi:MAG: cyclic nucleotide-binding domain-containing protein [Magnetococcales bacterium]|nr:cyclic nucleotide-binding domain-containing protein [Magnetococcales bacterium]MBF0439282.1 cyclic nucleotide-binding domain-containing protein [Magnetococcales bacterium]
MDLALVLGKTKLFEGVGHSDLEEIARFTERLIYESEYGQDKIVIAEQDPSGPDLYLILSGEVSLNKKESRSTVSLRKKIVSLEEEVYGEIAWILQQKHLSNVYTSTRVVLLRIDGVRLEQFLLNRPELAAVFWRRIAHTIAKRVTWTFRKYRSTVEWDHVFKF